MGLVRTGDLRKWSPYVADGFSRPHRSARPIHASSSRNFVARPS